MSLKIDLMTLYAVLRHRCIRSLEKLDRFLVSREWELLFPLTTVHKLSREISDHNPIILDTMEGREKQSREFRFDKRWLKDESFLAKVDRIWAQPVRARDSLSLFQLKLKKLKRSLKGWGANIRGRDIKRKKELNQELAELETIEETMFLSFDQAKRKSKIQEELMILYENEEAFWSQRSREQWLLKGDNNTEFFTDVQMDKKGRGLSFLSKMVRLLYKVHQIYWLMLLLSTRSCLVLSRCLWPD
jgi:hypothetical protein